MGMANQSTSVSNNDIPRVYAALLEWPYSEQKSRERLIQQASQLASDLEAHADLLRRAIDSLPMSNLHPDDNRMASVNDQACNSIINISQSIAGRLTSLTSLAISLLTKPSRK